MPLSILDMPAVQAAVSDLHRIIEDPTPTNETVQRVYRVSTARTTLGELDPEGKNPAAFIQAGIEEVRRLFGDHIRRTCPEITSSQLDLETKAALLELRNQLILPLFASHELGNDEGARVQGLKFLGDILRRLGVQESRENEKGDRPPRDPNQPSRDRQNDILAAIREAGMPLTRPEIIEAMKLKTEGKLGANLAWMVKEKILVSIPQRGYWPACDPIPE